jgi:hypothetical protein
MDRVPLEERNGELYAAGVLITPESMFELAERLVEPFAVAPAAFEASPPRYRSGACCTSPRPTPRASG